MKALWMGVILVLGAVLVLMPSEPEANGKPEERKVDTKLDELVELQGKEITRLTMLVEDLGERLGRSERQAAALLEQLEAGRLKETPLDFNPPAEIKAEEEEEVAVHLGHWETRRTGLFGRRKQNVWVDDGVHWLPVSEARAWGYLD